MKVLNCILENRFSGPVKRAFVLAGELKKYDIETVFLFDEKLRENIPIEGFKCFLIKRTQFLARNNPAINFFLFCLRAPYNLYKICNIIKNEKIDIVHANGMMNILPVLAAKVRRTKVVWHLNDTRLPWIARKIGTVLLQAFSDSIMITSRSVGTYYFGGNKELHRQATVVGIPVDLGQFNVDEIGQAQRTKIRDELGIPKGALVVGAVGNINRVKGYRYFIEAARLVKEEVGNAVFLIVGAQLATQKKLIGELSHLITYFGLEKDIIFTDFRLDVANIFSIMDVFVLASVSESGPLVVPEAMAMKVPVVATRVGLVPEHIVHNETGIIVEPAHTQALAEGIVAMIRIAPGTKQIMVERNLQRVADYFSVDTVTQRHRQIYEKVLVH